MKDSPYRVLVVDDDPDLRTIVMLSLRAHPRIEPMVAASGAECLTRFRSGEVWDLLVLDWMMPGMDGVVTLTNLRREGYTGPCAFFSAALQSPDLSKIDVDAVLSKPFDPLAFPKTVLSVIESG